MPTENEQKFVLQMESEDNLLALPKYKLLQIKQGYLMTSKGITLRFRDALDVNKQKHSRVMTFKCNTGERVVEIEKKVNKRDFHDVWKLCMNKVYKKRIVIDGWEIDIFKDHDGSTYFIMAEFEMPEGQERPDHIPKFISENLMFEVPLTDCRFSSKLISDVRYAKELYATVQKEKGYPDEQVLRTCKEFAHM